jgi:hypothetical protein
MIWGDPPSSGEHEPKTIEWTTVDTHGWFPLG